MSRIFKDPKLKSNVSSTYLKSLNNALKSTMSVCIASSSALIENDLSAKIQPERKRQYEENNASAMQGIGELRVFLHRVSEYFYNKKIDFKDARAPIKNIISNSGAGNCEHQSFYLAALLGQQNIPAFIYNIEDIQHTVVITNGYLLDPWVGDIFPLHPKELCEFYGSSLHMEASWLNQLLSDEPFSYLAVLDPDLLIEHFLEQDTVQIRIV